MKFITSRIVSPSQTRSLMEIIADNKKSEEAAIKKVASSEKKMDKVASSEKKTEKVASSGKKTEKVVAKKQPKKAVKEAAVEVKIKEVVAKKEIPKRVLKKIANLSGKDNGFLKAYFSRYYPADYVAALLADY